MRFAAAGVLSLLLACANPERSDTPIPAAPPPAKEPSRPPVQEPQTARPRDPGEGATEPAPTRREIEIDVVETANPLIVSGTARTFENSVSLRLLDAKGTLIVEDFTTSTGEIGHHNPFRAELWIVRDPGSRITIEAFEYSARDGSIRSRVSRSAAFDVETIRATLVFPGRDCGTVRQFQRNIPKSKSMARLVVEALVAGPSGAEKAAGATNPFPNGTDVRSVILRDGTITVDFNESLQNVGGACRAQAIRESVTQTLKRLPAVRNVVITAGGNAKLALQP